MSVTKTDTDIADKIFNDIRPDNGIPWQYDDWVPMMATAIAEIRADAKKELCAEIETILSRYKGGML